MSSYNNNSSPLLTHTPSDIQSQSKIQGLDPAQTGITVKLPDFLSNAGVSSPQPNAQKDSYLSPDSMNSDPAMLLNSIHRSVRIRNPSEIDPDLQYRSLSTISSYPYPEASAPILDLGSPLQDVASADPTSAPDSASSRKRAREGSEISAGFGEDEGGQNGGIYLSPFVNQGFEEPNRHGGQSSSSLASFDAAKVEQLVFTATRDSRNLFVCPIVNCGKTFTFKTNLRRHVTVHTGERRHVCVHCSARFSRSDDYAGHIRSQHPHAVAALSKNSLSSTDGRSRTNRAKREQEAAASANASYVNPLLAHLFLPGAMYGSGMMSGEMMMAGGVGDMGGQETSLGAPTMTTSSAESSSGFNEALNSSGAAPGLVIGGALTEQPQNAGDATNSSSSTTVPWPVLDAAALTLNSEDQSAMLMQAQERAQQQQLFQAWQMQLRRAEYEQATNNVLRYQIAQQQQELHAAQLHHTKVPRFNLASPITASAVDSGGSLSSPNSLSLSGVSPLLMSPHNPFTGEGALYSSPSSSILAPTSFRFSPPPPASSSSSASSGRQSARTSRQQQKQ